MNLRRAMSVSERLWFWAQPLLAALALAAGGASWVLQFTGNLSALPTVQSLITGQFVLPGLALSLLINQVAVSLRRPPMLTVGEKILLIIQLAVVGAILAISPSAELLFMGFLLWPLLIAVATTAFATMASTTIRSRRTLATDESEDILSEPTAQSR